MERWKIFSRSFSRKINQEMLLNLEMKYSKINISEAINIANLKIDTFDTELLLSFVKKVNRSYLYTHQNELLTTDEKTYFLN